MKFNFTGFAVTLTLLFVMPVFTLMSMNVLFHTDIALTASTWASAFWLHYIAYAICYAGFKVAIFSALKKLNIEEVQYEVNPDEPLSDEEAREVMEQMWERIKKDKEKKEKDNE